MTVAAILAQKGHDVVHVPPTMLVAEITRILAQHDIGAVLVLENESVCGIVSERDIARFLHHYGADTLEMTAERIMTAEVVQCTPDTTALDALALMTRGRFRHLPVVDHGRLCGLVSIGDVVKQRMAQQDYEVDNLRAYVTGIA